VNTITWYKRDSVYTARRTNTTLCVTCDMPTNVTLIPRSFSMWSRTHEQPKHRTPLAGKSQYIYIHSSQW